MSSDKTLKFDFPIPRTHCGVPMGNGMFGALVWGKDTLNITVNRADFWDHRGGETLIEGTTYQSLVDVYDPYDRSKLESSFIRADIPNALRPTRIPVGRFQLQPKDGVTLKTAEIDCKAGVLTITSELGGKNCEIKVIMDPGDDVLYLHDPENLIDSANAIPSSVKPWSGREDQSYMKEFYPPAPQAIEDGNIKGWVQKLPEDPSLASLCAKTESGWAVALKLGEDTKKAEAEARSAIEKFSARGADALFCANREWWKRYWEKLPRVNIPEEFFQQFLDYSLYKFACATSPYSTTPAGLQGPWVEDYQSAPWHADYHFNVNVQQAYILAFSSGAFDHALPLFDMLESESYQHVMHHNAKVLFGIDDGLLLTHGVDDRGYQTGWISAGSTLDHACGGWTAQLYWLYYQYTLDEKFLRERAYPFMYGIMRCFEEMLEEHEGRLSIPVSISAEYGMTFEGGKAQNAGRDPSYQLSCIHMLADALLETCEILSIEPRPIWKEMKERIPPYTLIGAEENRRIAIWENQDLDVCHRHHSHLACIYPFDSLGKGDENTDDIVDNSIDHWILRGMGQWSEWCIPWAAIIQSRLGFNEAPLQMLRMWREVFINEGMATVYLPRFRGLTAHRREDMLKPKETNEIMQIDGTMGGATALIEMLIHHHRGVVQVFPAVSDHWQDASFENAAVPGAFRVSATRKGGTSQNVNIESLKGGTIKINVSDWESAAITQGGKQSTIQLPASIEMKAGETAELKPAK